MSAKKRNRGLLSCTECHRRKQKCNRAKPCSDCIERGLPSQCTYLTSTQPVIAVGEQRKLAISRQRRIATGAEVELTPESVQALTALSALPISQSSSEAAPLILHEDEKTEEELEFLELAQNLVQGIENRLRIFSPYLPRRPTSPNVSSGLSYGLQYGSTLGGSDPFSILPEVPGEPVPKQLLIRYYIERLAPWMSYLDDNVNDQRPRLAWLPFALRHKALFNALLLTSAVHLNRRRPLRDPAAMLWFKVETIRIANENMTKTPETAASDEQIMVAMVLLYFNVGGSNIDEYEIHLRGIDQMLQVRGGIKNLGMRGMVKNWLGFCYGPWKGDVCLPFFYTPLIH